MSGTYGAGSPQKVDTVRGAGFKRHADPPVLIPLEDEVRTKGVVGEVQTIGDEPLYGVEVGP